MKKKKWAWKIAAALLLLLAAGWGIRRISRGEEGETISIQGEKIGPGGRGSYGPYLLEQGDRVSCRLTWRNREANLFFALGEQGGTLDFLETSGENADSLEAEYTVPRRARLYLFVGVEGDLAAERIRGTVRIQRARR